MIGNVIAKVGNPTHGETDLNTLVGFETIRQKPIWGRASPGGTPLRQ